MTDAPFTETLDDIAQSLFSELCEGDGGHSEALDRALIRKHLVRAIDAALAEIDRLTKENARLLRKQADARTPDSEYERRRMLR
jgi:hypothetical protein